MFLVLTGVLTRIVSNSYLNVFQKLLTSKGIKSSVVNFYTYFGLTIAGCLLVPIAGEIIFSAELLLNFLFMGILGALGNYFIIKALSCGELSSLAPINSYKPIVAMIIAFLYLGEIPEYTAGIGIFLIILGTYFIFDKINGANKSAVFFRVLALIFSGTEAVFIKKVIILTNVPMSFFLWAFSGLIFSLFFVIGGRNKFSFPPVKEQLLLIFSVGMMQFSTNYVFANMKVSYALSLFQLSTLLSVFLGVNIFHENGLTRKILASIVMITGAVIIIWGQ